ncbi:MAG: flagellar biosynthetic protein FliO [Planctomycetota bacterium]
MTRAALIAAAVVAGAIWTTSTARADAFADTPIIAADSSTSSEPTQTTATGPSATRVLASLAGVGLLIVATGWAWRRFMPGGPGAPGASAVKLAARVNLTPKHQVFVLRVGHRLLVVGDSGHGMNALAQITDGDEVADVLAACGAASATDDPLKADAFAATFAEARGDNGSSLFEVDVDDDTMPEPPPQLGDDVRSLIERVRGLSAAHRQEGAS